MLPIIIRTASITIAVALTIAFPVGLYVLTFAGCYGESANCAQGWLYRTIGTAAYLAVVAGLIVGTRALLRGAARRDRMM